MKKIILAAAALTFALPAPAQAPAVSDPAAFALALHRRLAGGENIMTSPYSLRQALGMAYAGAAGGTRDEMTRALRAGPAFVEEEAALRRELATANGPAILKIGNALFVKEGCELLPSFLKTAKDAFDAGIFVRKFGPAAVAEINRWASAATNGRIPSILKELKETDRLVLLNAVYFKGKWATQFPKVRTERTRRGGKSGGPMAETFSPTGGKPFALKLMSVDDKFPYAERTGWKAVRLPYKGGRLAMIAVLPDEGTNLPALRERLDAPAWAELRAGLKPRDGLVAIPKFKFEQAYDMVEPLRKLGMKLAFDAAKSDFSGISKPPARDEELYISRIVQKTFVAVDEEGTEAAAVTAGVMGGEGERGAARGAVPLRRQPPVPVRHRGDRERDDPLHRRGPRPALAGPSVGRRGNSRIWSCPPRPPPRRT